MERFVVVGAGHAGGRAVEAMRMAGFEGEIVLVGAEPHLPYERPPLSKEVLQARPDYTFPFIRPRDYFDAQRIELRLGAPATAIDPTARTVTLAGGTMLDYDKLLLTTGGRVRTLPLPGSDLANVFYLRTLDDARAIDAMLTPGRRLVVIGGGFIGLEVAASARQRGVEVTVVEIAERLMGRGVPHTVSAHFLALHRANGVDVRLGTGVERLDGDDRVAVVVTSGGGAIEADLVVIGVGIVPAVELAEQAGIEVDNGIVVDEYCRTSEADIYAAGDATSHYNPLLRRRVRLEAWQCAQNMAIAAARIMCGSEEPYAEIPWMWSDQYDANLQVAGMPENWDELVLRGDPDSGSFIGFALGDGEIAGTVAVNQPRDMRLARRMMGGGKTFTAEELADEGIPMRELSKR